MTKIKDYNISTTNEIQARYTIKDSFFDAEVTLYFSAERVPQSIDQDVYIHEGLIDYVIEFYIGSERCQQAGFKELYAKMFGANSYTSLTDELRDKAEEHYWKHTPFTPIEELTKAEAEEAFEQLVKKVNKKTVGSVTYSSNHILRKLANIAEKKDVVHAMVVPHTEIKDTTYRDHNVVVIDWQ